MVVKKRLLDRITNNLALKIISVIIAIIIWYVVVDMNDPVVSQPYVVRVTVENESYIANGKQIFSIDEEYKTVTVYVKANQSVLNKLTSDDIKVTADLTQIVDLERTPVMVPLSVSCTAVDQNNLTLSRITIPINIETIASQEFPIVVDTGDTTPDNGYEVGKLTASVNSVVINGPESIVTQIDSVIARIDVTGMSSDGTRKASLVIVDKALNKLSEDVISDNLSFEDGYPQITVDVDLWARRSDVGFNVICAGSPAEGYQVSEIKTVPATISVVGDDAALKALENAGNKISIPSSKINVSGASTNQSFEVDINEILEGNIRTASTTKNTVMINVTILPNGTKEIAIDVDKIDPVNLDTSLTISYDQTALKMKIKGSDADLSVLSQDNIHASIDLSGYTAGDYVVPVSIQLPSLQYSLLEDVTITVHLKEKAGAIQNNEGVAG